MKSFFNMSMLSGMLMLTACEDPRFENTRSVADMMQSAAGVYVVGYERQFTLIILPDKRWLFCSKGHCDQGVYENVDNYKIHLLDFYKSPSGLDYAKYSLEGLFDANKPDRFYSWEPPFTLSFAPRNSDAGVLHQMNRDTYAYDFWLIQPLDPVTGDKQ